MKYLSTFVILFICIGCVDSRSNRIIYSDPAKWESVKVRHLGIGLDAPKNRFYESVSDQPFLGGKVFAFSLHRKPREFPLEDRLKISITIKVYNKDEWQRFLRGEETWLRGEFEPKLHPLYFRHRKDVTASDGRVIVAHAHVDQWADDERVDGMHQDEATVKRIIESVNFLKK